MPSSPPLRTGPENAPFKIVLPIGPELATRIGSAAGSVQTWSRIRPSSLLERLKTVTTMQPAPKTSAAGGRESACKIRTALLVDTSVDPTR